MSDSEITKYEGEQPDERPGEDQTHPEGIKPPSEIGEGTIREAHDICNLEQWEYILPEALRSLEQVLVACSNTELIKFHRYLRGWEGVPTNTQPLRVLVREIIKHEVDTQEILKFLRMLAICGRFTGHHLHHPKGKGEPSEGTGCNAVTPVTVQIRSRCKHYMRIIPVEGSNGEKCAVITNNGRQTLTTEKPLIIGRDNLTMFNLFKQQLKPPVTIKSDIVFENDSSFSRAALMLRLHKKREWRIRNIPY